MVEKNKRGYLTEDDCFSVLNRYNLTTIITLLKEITEYTDVKIDWKILVKRSSTGISNAREYQMLWRHLAYREPLFQNLVETEPEEDDSDLEFELEAVPPLSAEASLQATKCIEVVMSSGLSKESSKTKGMTPEAPLSAVRNTMLLNSVAEKQALMPAYNEALHGSETAFPNKKRRRHYPWTAQEEEELIAAVKKHGEGNWLIILKEDFKHDRTPSQLSQKWNSIKKQVAFLNLPSVDKKDSSVLSDEQLATRKAISMALDIPRIRSLSALTSGSRRPPYVSPDPSLFKGTPVSYLEASKKLQQDPHHTSPQKRVKKSQTTCNNNQTSMVIPNPLIQAAALAAGGRIIDPSTVASLLEAAQTKNVYHIKNGENPIPISKYTTDAFRTRSSDSRCTKSTPQTFMNLSSIFERKPGPSSAH